MLRSKISLIFFFKKNPFFSVSWKLWSIEMRERTHLHNKKKKKVFIFLSEKPGEQFYRLLILWFALLIPFPPPFLFFVLFLPVSPALTLLHLTLLNAWFAKVTKQNFVLQITNCFRIGKCDFPKFTINSSPPLLEVIRSVRFLV